jgi:hypothetical protein
MGGGAIGGIGDGGRVARILDALDLAVGAHIPEIGSARRLRA